MRIRDFINACLMDWDFISVVTHSTNPQDDEVIPVGRYAYAKDIPDNVWLSTIDNFDIITVDEVTDIIITI